MAKTKPAKKKTAAPAKSPAGSKGLNPVLEHRPAIGDRGRPIYFYAIVEVTGAQPLWDVFTADEIKEMQDIVAKA